MKNVIFTHYDLDGVCSLIVADAFLVGEMNYYSAGYGKIEQRIKEIIKDHANTKYRLVITDLCLRPEELELFCMESNIKNILYIDHHPKKISEYQYLIDKFPHLVFIQEEGIAGAMVTFNFFMKYPHNLKSNFVTKLRRLVKIADTYDIWRLDSELFKFAFQVNELLWGLGFDEFFKTFRDGFTWNDSLQSIVDKVEDEKKSYMKETYDEGMTEVVCLPQNLKALVVLNPEGKFVNDFAFFNPQYHFFIIFGFMKPDFFNISLRANEKIMPNGFDWNDYIKKIESENGVEDGKVAGGGHPAACGITFYKNSGIDVEKAVNIILEKLTDDFIPF